MRTPPSSTALPGRGRRTGGRPRPADAENLHLSSGLPGARRSISKKSGSPTSPVHEHVRNTPPGDTTCNASRFMSVYFSSAPSTSSRSRVSFAGRGRPRRTARRSDRVPQPREQVGLDEPDLHPFNFAFCFASSITCSSRSRPIDSVAPWALAYTAEPAGVAADVQHPLAPAEAAEELPVVPLVDEEPGLVFRAGGDAELECRAR